MWGGAMVYWSWRMAPSWNSLLITNHSMEGACVHHRLLQLATGKLRTTEIIIRSESNILRPREAAAAGRDEGTGAADLVDGGAGNGNRRRRHRPLLQAFHRKQGSPGFGRAAAAAIH